MEAAVTEQMRWENCVFELLWWRATEIADFTKPAVI